MGTEFVERMRGSKWNRALPGEFIDRTGGSKWVQAQPAGSKWQSALPTIDRGEDAMSEDRPKKPFNKERRPYDGDGATY